jgi:hypothetical protein
MLNFREFVRKRGSGQQLPGKCFEIYSQNSQEIRGFRVLRAASIILRANLVQEQLQKN